MISNKAFYQANKQDFYASVKPPPSADPAKSDPACGPFANLNFGGEMSCGCVVAEVYQVRQSDSGLEDVGCCVTPFHVSF